MIKGAIELMQYDYDILFDTLEDTPIIVKAVLGLWDGEHHGGAICSSIREFFARASRDIERWRFVYAGTTLCLIGSHHDGINYYYLKALKDGIPADYTLKRSQSYIENLFDDEEKTLDIEPWQ